MKSTIVFPMVLFASMAAAADVPSAQVQIAGAVLAAKTRQWNREKSVRTLA